MCIASKHNREKNSILPKFKFDIQPFPIFSDQNEYLSPEAINVSISLWNSSRKSPSNDSTGYNGLWFGVFFFFFKEGGRTSGGGFWHRLSPSARNLFPKSLTTLEMLFLSLNVIIIKRSVSRGESGSSGVHDVLDFTDRKLIIWH